MLRRCTGATRLAAEKIPSAQASPHTDGDLIARKSKVDQAHGKGPGRGNTARRRILTNVAVWPARAVAYHPTGFGAVLFLFVGFVSCRPTATISATVHRSYGRIVIANTLPAVPA